MKYLKCTKCGWIHFGMTLSEVTEEITHFNKHYNSLSKKAQKEYGGTCSRITDYLYCFRCEVIYTEMRKAKKSEIPIGVTVQPILIEEKKNGKQRVRRIKRKTNQSVRRSKD